MQTECEHLAEGALAFGNGWARWCEKSLKSSPSSPGAWKESLELEGRCAARPPLVSTGLGGAAPVEHSLVLALQLTATHAATPPLNNNNNYNQAGFGFPAEGLKRCRRAHSSPAPHSRAGWGVWTEEWTLAGPFPLGRG